MIPRDHSPKDWSGLGGKAGLSGAATEDVFVFPASLPQQRLWRMAGDAAGGAFNVPEAFRIVGPLNVAVLERAIAEIAARHEILRTVFSSVDGLPVQLVFPPKPILLPAVDLRILDPGQRNVEADRFIEEEIHTPFDLKDGPLFRARLLCLDEREYILLINSHPIITDAGSGEVFERELAASYQAFSAGEPSPLPELPIQYGDFAEWQRAAIQTEEFARQLAYWKGRLRDAPVLQLPPDRPRPAVPSFQGATERFELPASLVEGARALSKKQGVTLFTTLLAAFHALLSRYAGQGDIVIASPVPNRSQPGVEALLGLFANTLLLRTDMGGDPRFSDFLLRVRDTVSGALDNQDIPFEVVAEDLGLDAGQLGRVMFAFTPGPRAERQVAGLTLSPVAIPNRAAAFELALSLVERPAGIDGFLHYSTDLFDPERVRLIATHLNGLLDAVVAAPHTRISELPLLLTGSVRRLLSRPPPQTSGKGGVVPAQGWMQKRLVEIWEDLFEVQPIGVTHNFFALGGNPLLASAMCSRVEKVIGRKLTPEALSENPTIEDLTNYFAITKVQAEGSKPPFFFLHGDFLDGGLYCINLARRMSKDRPFYKIDPHGWDGRAMPATIEAMAASRLEILFKTQKEGPYYLGGYCNGGLVAFEMARQLEAQGKKVACLVLVLVDAINVQFAPLFTAVSLWGGMHRMNDRDRQELFLKWRQAWLFARASLRHHMLALRATFQMEFPQACARLKRKSLRILRRFTRMVFPSGEAAPAAAGPALAEGEFDVSRTYREAVCSYIPRRYGGKVFLLRQTEPDPGIRITDPTFNWKTVAKRLTVHVVPGGHFTAITVYSNLTVLTERLQTCLDETTAAGPV